MKISPSSSGASISGSLGGQKGSVGISPKGIELAIDAGVGKLGISTDYGGGVVIGIAGQKIVWGREGGKIHYSLLGLELIIEARDCIVVETQKIAGQIVASHTYPDPGCKPPKPPKPPGASPPPGTSLPPGALSPGQIDRAMPQRSCQSLCVIANVYDSEQSRYETEQVCWGEKNLNVGTVARPRFDGTKLTGWCSGLLNYVDSEDEISGSLQEWIEGFFSPYAYGFREGYNYFTMSPETRSRCFPETPAPAPPSAGNRPPMPQDCCKQLAADLADLKEVLATKEILQGKLTFPWRLRMPGGQGEEVIKNYPNLARAMVQVIDHLGIHPPKLSIKDINNAIAGDQSISNQFPCATQGFEALMAQVWDANADVDTLTNFLYRLSWLCVQQSMNLAVVSADIQSIKDMIGGKTTPDKATITTPFNIGAGVKETTKGKGFEKNKNGEIDKKIDANTELSTESLLPDFLKIRDNDIIIERYTGDKDVVDMLSLILLKLETLSAR